MLTAEDCAGGPCRPGSLYSIQPKCSTFSPPTCSMAMSMAHMDFGRDDRSGTYHSPATTAAKRVHNSTVNGSHLDVLAQQWPQRKVFTAAEGRPRFMGSGDVAQESRFAIRDTVQNCGIAELQNCGVGGDVQIGRG